MKLFQKLFGKQKTTQGKPKKAAPPKTTSSNLAKIMAELPLAWLFGPPPGAARIALFLDSGDLPQLPLFLSAHSELRLEILVLTDQEGAEESLISIADPLHGKRAVPVVNLKKINRQPELERVLFIPSTVQTCDTALRLAASGLFHVVSFAPAPPPACRPYYYATWSRQLQQLSEQLADTASKKVLAGRVKALCSGNPGYHRQSPYRIFAHPRVAIGDDDLIVDKNGEELESLKAAEALLRERKPNLAVALHHDPNAIMTVPQYLSDLRLGYVFYLGHHSLTDQHTYLYAAPRTK